MSDAQDLTLIKGSGDDLRGAVEALRRSLPIMLQLGPEIAAYRRAMFLAYVDQGFTEPQALELCKAVAL